MPAPSSSSSSSSPRARKDSRSSLAQPDPLSVPSVYAPSTPQFPPARLGAESSRIASTRPSRASTTSTTPLSSQPASPTTSSPFLAYSGRDGISGRGRSITTDSTSSISGSWRPSSLLHQASQILEHQLSHPQKQPLLPHHSTSPPSTPITTTSSTSSSLPRSQRPHRRSSGPYQDVATEEEDAEAAEEEERGESTAVEPGASPVMPGIPGRKRRVSINPLTQQEIHMEEEDLYLLISAYRTFRPGHLLYLALCILTVGIFYLAARWVPRLRIALVGRPSPLESAEWLVIQNQYGQREIEPVLRIFYGGEARHVYRSPPDLSPGTPVSGVLRDLVIFQYRHLRFVYDPTPQCFIRTSTWRDAAWDTGRSSITRGLSREAARDRRTVHGPNLMDVQPKSVGTLLVDEVLHPFYIFQLASIGLWAVDNYYYYAACIFTISIISVITALIETRRNMAKMRDMARFTCDVLVRRGGSGSASGDGTWIPLDSDHLVPGDLLDISALQTFPCDAILIDGDCIVNESMLTGESVPVSKTPITDSTLKYLDPASPAFPISPSLPQLEKNFLHAGTKVVRARPGPQGRTVAMVIRVGFDTTKGSLVRSMLYPRPNKFKFYQDAFHFVGVLAIVAGCGFLASVYNFIQLGVPAHLIIVRALDLITIVIPPALPATMSIGMSFALSRLRREEIYCIAPQRVNVAGKLNCLLFDKTGTLTEDGLDVLGVQPSLKLGAQEERAQFTHDMIETPEGLKEKESEEVTGSKDPDAVTTHPLPPTTIYPFSSSSSTGLTPSAPPSPLSLTHCLATCHALKMVQDSLVGDPLDLKMFDWTNWSLEEHGTDSSGVTRSMANNEALPMFGGPVPTTVRPPGAGKTSLATLGLDPSPSAASTSSFSSPSMELGILKCYEFVSNLRRMSVLVKRLGDTSTLVYAKGAPEAIGSICRPSTLPPNYATLLHRYTHQGYRVIACAGRDLGRVSWRRAERLDRSEVECGLIFLGLLVFENKLKPTTAHIISQLHDARMRQVMCTGDNVLTAVSVSRECGLVPSHCRIYMPIEGEEEEGIPQGENDRIQWRNVDDPKDRLDPNTLLPHHPYPLDPGEGGGPPSPIKSFDTPYELAVTGTAFQRLIHQATHLRGTEGLHAVRLLHRVLLKGQIFARMSPEEKAELVERMQGLGYCVGFCGDGANDCGALKAADVGVSLSEAEASVAAPFTSRSTDIACMVQVIREGRAALVTSFACFKYMALYSLIQFTTISLLYSFDFSLGDLQFLYIDLVLILPVAIFMGRTGPAPKLHPARPIGRLVSRKVLTSLLGHIFLQLLAQVLLFNLVRRASWYVPPIMNPDAANILSLENTALFLLSSYQYTIIAIIFSVGPPHRLSMLSNRSLVGAVAFLLAFTSFVLTLAGAPEGAEGIAGWFRNAFELKHIPGSFLTVLASLALAYWMVAWIGEQWIFPGLAKAIKAYRVRRDRKREWEERWRAQEQGGSSPVMITKPDPEGSKVYKRIQREMQEDQDRLLHVST
ncbi:MAG: P-type ATPase P5 type [Piptocephalis tieghemiana]|nr:MAG: P-type ATPase P5 type [Piptocephalis tieghemiana]